MLGGIRPRDSDETARQNARDFAQPHANNSSSWCARRSTHPTRIELRLLGQLRRARPVSLWRSAMERADRESRSKDYLYFAAAERTYISCIARSNNEKNTSVNATSSWSHHRCDMKSLCISATLPLVESFCAESLLLGRIRTQSFTNIQLPQACRLCLPDNSTGECCVSSSDGVQFECPC
ncbi:uncharacterized protein B0I36DRAFT_163121 [Microdochium trichocladiopsis]|uniref:Uncharacterized protein n=1 Tax=Microdochium trichocladiopsis TaxID=1682393 RepID=A0A9P8Y0I1_9PEZI|nr:uncharacterized protein B0I36DRAFT_163121 [Microdochium trichocladiopsis]KAH7024606.1 hypothetical protein B0I36DRAFT_163121 [Microdochium trichocladiopsis]